MQENFDREVFIPVSQLAEARRKLLDALASAGKATYRFDLRLPENPDAQYPVSSLDFHDNVANHLAEGFYRDHGVAKIEKALEIDPSALRKGRSGRSVMTTRHCILRENGRCLRETPAEKRDFKLPLKIKSGQTSFMLDFDCSRCEMHVLTADK